MTYQAPVDTMTFVLNDVIGLPKGREDLDQETISGILEGAADLANSKIAPLREAGDQIGANRNEDGSVKTAPGYVDAYKAFIEGGWNGVPFDEAYGGMELPWALTFPLQEMWQSADMSFGLCPLLTQGAIEAISVHGSDELKETYLEKLVSGEWTGTMNLTEPQAGTDLALLKSKAERQDDGAYKISGNKIFITYGEHDMAENIIHLVLARLPDAPAGVKGISLFLVPKILEDGTQNDVTCTGTEHKMGIHGSPTCSMSFGDNGGAVGYLIGEENQGLRCMFTMMNNARLAVGLQGVAISEAATQHALEYAQERIQSASLSDKSGGSVAIINHPDVKRMLLTMQAYTQAGRMLAYEAARNIDLAHDGDDVAQRRVDLLTPIVKGWCTDIAQEVTHLGVQVYGGMGFVEETGAAQYQRDARILPIYEGTNGIQGLDLALRKVFGDSAQGANVYLDELKRHVTEMSAQADLKSVAQALEETLNIVEQQTQKLLEQADTDIDLAAAGATPYMSLWGTVAGGVMMGRAALAAHKNIENGVGNAEEMEHIITLSRFYAGNILPKAHGYAACMDGGQSVLDAKFV